MYAIKILSIFALLSSRLFAQEPPPANDIQVLNATLVARANQTDGFQLPAGSILGIADVKLNNRGDIAFDVDVLGATEQAAVWFAPKGGEGKVVFRPTVDGRLLSDPGLNNRGDLVFSQFDFGVTDGVFKYDANARATELVIRPDRNQGFSFPAINDIGTVVTRIVDEAGDRSFRVVNGGQSKIIAKEGVKDAQGTTLSYLFRPVLNNQGFVAAKVRRGERGQVDETQPDVIRLWKPDGSYEVVAVDIHAEPSSLFFSFGNSVGISDAKHVVFTATVSGDKQAIFLFGEGKIKALAIEGQGDLEAIEAFAPVVNSKGIVAFRGRLKSGKSAILSADWNGFKVVAKQGDLITSDLETAKIYDRADNQGFVGGLAINDSGSIAFHAGILSKDGERFLGQGIYLLSTTPPPAGR
tara:strand:+ start:48628 stop:49860 length:1233 start_codon:yes stop_codon:yes gene_type:complete